MITGAGVTFTASHTVQAGPLHGVSPLRAILSIIRLAIGLMQGLWLMARIRPQAAFLTGGWVGVPVAVAAWLWRVPIIIFVPDIEPGLTLKVLGRFARIITATTADTQAFFSGKKVVATGYPLRNDMLNITQAEGQANFPLQPDLKTLLVFGGSRGARSINRAILRDAAAITHELGLQILHVTGSLDWPEVQAAHEKMSADLKARYHIYEYLHQDMGLALAAAHIVVSRAGASILGEFPYFGLPAVVVPYPYAWRYQKVNADWLVSRGAALLVEDEKLADALLPALQTIVNDYADQQRFVQNMEKLRIENGAENIAAVIWKEMEH